MNAAGNTRSSAERGPPPKPGLRRSYTRAVLAAGVVLAIPSGLLAAAGSGAAAAGVLVPAWLWFFLMVRVLRGQLSLVRPPGSYRLYDRFLPSNGLTLLRLLAAPLVALAVAWGPEEPLARWTVFVLYTAVALTDVLDGWLARSRNECSVFGRTFDHVTDVALGTFLTLALWWAGLLPDWFVVLCLVRFLLPVLGGGVFWMKEVAWRIEPSIIGKITVVCAALVALVCLLPPEIPSLRPGGPLFEGLLDVTAFLVGLNLVYQVRRGIVILRS